MTTFVERMCKAADHRTGSDLEQYLADKVERTEGMPQIDLIPIDDVKNQLFKIEQREHNEYVKIYNLIGPPPQPEDEMNVDESNQQSQGSQNNKDNEKDGKEKEGKEGKDKNKEKDDAAFKQPEKKKQKKSAKKDLPESLKTQITNTAALMAAGGHVKAWMLPGGVAPSLAPSAPPKKKSVTRLVPKTVTGSGIQSGSAGSPLVSQSIRVGRVQKSLKRVSLRDALFTMEQFRPLKASSSLYKWWANIK